MSFLLNWANATIVSAMPLLLACLGTIIAGRAGVLALGAEGYLAMGAVLGVGVTLATGSIALGLCAAAVAGVALAGLFAGAAVLLRADQVVSGLATAALGSGLAGFIGRDFAQQQTPAIGRLPLGQLRDILVIGPIVLGQNVLVYLAIALVVATSLFLNRSLAGLRLRAVGEQMYAADAAGLPVNAIRCTAVMAGGAVCALGGASLSLGSAQVWVENMVAGRGWIAIALVVFAAWSPARAVVGALMFGAIDALVPLLQASGVRFPTFLLMSTPYLATIGVLATSRLFDRDAHEPAALGLAFIREERT